ncbi:tripartite tricarboxylate transporter TctB family protein [Xanthobacter dioxanivorans]|uniref:Tripartite tricarboxylate transporter TctB family protein n=1 Tax=Xanthobacter dioxanivorans TaxID=2528964 RepID=A0A974PSD0_9HYPH|nr:tripartite tricarboxylate transporter TctB family protein [Xanthobacter dioxanivorans]QRG08882.1 tripartite tricarboxylate transporter TctB family protein [Xanthobacter dioxanivorans]
MQMNRDVIAGSFVVLVGATALLMVSHLPFDGEGPSSSSFFPRLVAWMILGVGAFIVLDGLRTQVAMPRWRPRPIGALVAGILAFSLLVEPGGLVLAAGACALLGSFATPFPDLRKRVATAVVVTALAVLVFKVFLKLNLSVWPTWIS